MKADLIGRLQKSREGLLSIVNRLPDEGILVDKWGKKEILAHIDGWEEEAIVSIPQVMKGKKSRSFRVSINTFNKENVAKRKDKTTQELLKELLTLREKLMAEIEQLSEEQIEKYYGTMLGKKLITVSWILNEIISHDNSHAKELDK